MTNVISRRHFIAGAAAGAATLAAGAAHAAVPASWDETVDVIVVGSGFAGLMAGYMAKKAGADVLIIEKMPTTGGNSVINGYGLNYITVVI